MIDPKLAEAHEALSTIARYTESEWENAIAEASIALALDPNLELPHHNMTTEFYHLGFSRYLGSGEPSRRAGEP